MKFIVAYIAFITVSVLFALCLGFINHGLNKQIAYMSLLAGLISSLLVVFKYKFSTKLKEEKLGFWSWAIIIFFIIFSLRSFLWLIFRRGDSLNVLHVTNLGDIVYHITHIRYFAQGVPFWPESPFITGEKIRYHFGLDLFNSLLVLVGYDLFSSLILVGLLSSAAIAILLIAWGGAFTLSGFLFNGGLAGFQFFKTFNFYDYQGSLDWKSIPLAMFIPQRPLLYAIPAGLLLLLSWREKYFRASENTKGNKLILPFWLEVLIYSLMPIFNVHTFIFMSIFLLICFLIVSKPFKTQLVKLAIYSFPIACFLILMLTDFFKKGSMAHLDLEYIQSLENFFKYWIFNFGIFWPLVIWLFFVLLKGKDGDFESKNLTFIGTFTFILFSFVILSNWRYDNAKILQWSYILILPYLWKKLISNWDVFSKYLVCFMLFFSGFVCVIDSMSKRHGYQVFKVSELYGVSPSIKNLPCESRFATYSTYNHPLLFYGRKLVLAYPGWLAAHGVNYSEVEKKLKSLMLGESNWRELAKELQARYIYWGTQEEREYYNSTRPWEKVSKKVFEGTYCRIYDLSEL